MGNEYIFRFEVVVNYPSFVEIADSREAFGEDAITLLFLKGFSARYLSSVRPSIYSITKHVPNGKSSIV